MSNISYLSIKTIIIFEIRDYFKEFQFTVIAPLITTILFVFIFSTLDRYYSLNNSLNSYMNFLIPGILMTVVMQTSFNHLSEIIINMKQIGSFDDYLISPISRIELFFSLIITSIIVSLIVGYINIIVLSFFANFETINYFYVTYYLILCILIFSSLGALTGFLSYTWDFQSSVSNFFIVPISLFSGSFFPIEVLDKKFIFLFSYNPFYYLIDGFRSSFDFNNKINLYTNTYILFFTISIILICLYVFKKGFRVIK